MATLTTYTQALQHIDTLEFDTPEVPLKEFSYIPNGQPNAGHTLTLKCAMKSDAPILHGHIYRIDADWFTPSIYGRLHHATMAAADTELQFKPLNTEAEKIVRAVLAERDTHEAKSAGRSYTLADLHAMQDRINRLAAFAPFTFTWDRHSPFPTWTYGDSPQWREGEGNNP